MNKLIKYLFFVLLALCVRYQATGQPGGALPFNNANRPQLRPTGMRRLDAAKNAYINKQLNLTPEEADRFWPLYNQYQSELTAILQQRRQNNSNPQPNGIDQVDKDLNYEQRILTLRKHYRDEFLKILPAEKVSMLYKSEREFKDELLKQLKERNNPGN